MKKIIIAVHKQPSACTGNIVRITDESQDVLNQLMRDSGASARKIVSELITQCADSIEFREVD